MAGQWRRRALAGQPSVSVSPATVRNIMARLEGQGLVKSPHTSAGKVPTSQGLRFFVESLLAVEPLDDAGRRGIEAQLDPDLPPSELIESASEALSRITSMACVVTLPRQEQAALRHVEFLKLDAERVLAILVFNDREVQNRVIHTDHEYQDADLVRAANFINQEFGGLTLGDARSGLLASMQRDKDRMDSLLQSALDMAAQAFAQAANRGQGLCGRRGVEPARHQRRYGHRARPLRGLHPQGQHPAPARPVPEHGGHTTVHRR